MIACGCAATETTSSGVLLNGELELTVNVSGDPATAPRAFGITIDQSDWLLIPPNGTDRRSLADGSYHVSLGYWGATSPAWCSPAEPLYRVVGIKAGEQQKVVFSVDCPSAEGTASLLIRVVGAVLGPPTFLATFTRLAPDSGFSVTRVVSRTAQTDVSVPPGVYQVKINTGPTCSLSGPWIHGIPLRLRNGETASLSISIRCGLVFPPGIP